MTSGTFASHARTAVMAGGSTPKGLERWLGLVLERMVRGFLALWLLAAAWIVVAFVTPPREILRAADWQLDAGPVEGYEIGRPRMVRSGPQPVWVVRHADTTFVALAAVCQYQHCVLRWNPVLGLFECPCHHGTYDLEGSVRTGPSRQALRSFFVNIKAERVRVHLLRPVEEES